MRGDHHARLKTLLLKALEGTAGVTRTSLAAATEMHPSTMGGILGKDEGTLDLDEAEAALRHVGSTLADFLGGQPPRDLSGEERLCRALVARPELHAHVADLLDVPQNRLDQLFALIDGYVSMAIGRPSRWSAARPSAPTPEPRTKSAPKRRR